MLFPTLAIITRVIWIAIEYPYLLRHEASPQRDWDKHSAKLWNAANLIEPIGLWLGWFGVGQIHASLIPIGLIGMVLLSGGIAVRWAAIYTLGQPRRTRGRTLETGRSPVFLNATRKAGGLPHTSDGLAAPAY